MDQRRVPWGWVIVFFGLLIVVGAVAYWFGAGHHVVGLRMVPHPGFGFFGFWLPILILALLVGLAVAALAPSARREETFEEWHHRAHARSGPAHPEVRSAPPTPDAGSQDSAPSDDSGT